MHWHELYGADTRPTEKNIAEYVHSPLWDGVVGYAVADHKAKLQLDYSKCKMDGGLFMGWNLKLKKSGKNLCTIYPKQGYYLALITVAAKHVDEASILIKGTSDYTRNLFHKTKTHSHYGKMLCLEVRSPEIAEDLKMLIDLRATG